MPCGLSETLFMFKHIFLHAPLRLMLMPLLFKALIATCVAQDALPDTPPVLLQMVRDDMVHQDMKLSSEQIQSLRSILKPIDERWFFSRNLPLTNQKTEVQTLTDELRRKLASILDADGDGSMMDDIVDLTKGTSKGGLGGLLSRVLGKR